MPLFYPSPKRSRPPPGAVEHLIEVGPDVRVHAREHTLAAATCRVILFHGNGEVVSDYDPYAAEWARSGATLVVVDYRGYGASTGVSTAATLVEDAVPVFDTLVAQLPPLPTFVFGRSLGTAPAAAIAAARHTSLAGVIIESGFARLPPELDDGGLAPGAHLRRSRAPLLLIHGAEDDLLLPSQAELLLRGAGSGDASLVLLARRGHNDISFHPAYWRHLHAFVTAYTAAG